jgi:hypothetical protein
VRLLPPIAAALLATSASAATVRVVPWRAAGVSEAQVATVVRAADAALRELSTLVPQPALLSSPLPKRCGAEDPGCWMTLAVKANADYGLVLAADPSGGLTVDLVLVDLKARKVAQRRVTAPTPDAAAQAARNAVEVLVPAYLRKGYGGFLVDLPAGSRLKVDGKVVLAEPSRAPVPVPNGRHEVDLLSPDGTAVLTRAAVAEGQVAPLQLSLRPAPSSADRPAGNNALKITSAVLWTAGTAAAVSAFGIAAAANFRASNVLRPCNGQDRTCITQEQAVAAQAEITRSMYTADALLIGGGVLAAGGGVVFTFDLLQGGGK